MFPPLLQRRACSHTYRPSHIHVSRGRLSYIHIVIFWGKRRRQTSGVISGLSFGARQAISNEMLSSEKLGFDIGVNELRKGFQDETSSMEICPRTSYGLDSTWFTARFVGHQEVLRQFRRCRVRKSDEGLQWGAPLPLRANHQNCWKSQSHERL